MPRTREQLEQAAADAERWLDQMDPAELNNPEADSTDLRRIGLALAAVALAAVAVSEAELAEAVRAARAQRGYQCVNYPAQPAECGRRR